MRVTRDIDPSEILPGVEGGEFRPPPPLKKKRRWWLRILLLLIVLGGGAYGYVHFGGKMPAMLGSTEGEPPVIKADAGPVKVKPENPGGAEIPDRDKLVYQRLSGTPATEPKIERLLPAPEAPLPPPAPPAPAVQQPLPKVPTEAQVKAATVPAPATVVEPMGKVPAAKPAEAPPPPAVPTEAVTVASNAPKAPPAAPPSASSEPARELAAKTEPIKAAPKVPVPAASGAYQIQIAAVRQEDLAKREWARLQRVHPDLLGDLGLVVVRADLGAEKGVFYRLRAGPLASEAAARKRCSDLAKVKVGCLVVKARE